MAYAYGCAAGPAQQLSERVTLLSLPVSKYSWFQQDQIALLLLLPPPPPPLLHCDKTNTTSLKKEKNNHTHYV
jgi:hypothetical protein